MVSHARGVARDPAALGRLAAPRGAPGVMVLAQRNPLSLLRFDG